MGTRGRGGEAAVQKATVRGSHPFAPRVTGPRGDINLMSLYVIIKVSPGERRRAGPYRGRINYWYQSAMLSEGATWLRKETRGQRHLAVINEVTFPTALAEI